MQRLSLISEKWKKEKAQTNFEHDIKSHKFLPQATFFDKKSFSKNVRLRKQFFVTRWAQLFSTPSKFMQFLTSFLHERLESKDFLSFKS